MIIVIEVEVVSDDGQHTLMINDAEAEDKKGNNGIFSYTHEEQQSHIKSIICYKVVGPRKHVIFPWEGCSIQ